MSNALIYRGVVVVAAMCGFTAAHADAVVLSYNVVGKDNGYIRANLVAENISGETLRNVTVESNIGAVPLLSYGDIMPGIRSVQPMTLSWNPAAEPPSLNWTVTYVDIKGQLRKEQK